MPPATRSGQKETDRTAQVGICTESEANAFGIFRNVGSKQAEVKRQRSDASVPSQEIHQRRRGVALGANPVPKPGERVAKATSVTQRKCPQTTTTLHLEITTGGNKVMNHEAVVNEPRAKRRRQPQEPIADTGLALRANIAPELDQRTTEPPSNCGGTEFVAPESGYGASMDANHVLLNAQGDAGESRVLRSHSARRGLTERVVRKMDNFPKQKKEPSLPESQGEKPHAQAAAVVAATESEKVSQGPSIAPKSRKYPRRQPARITRSRKNIPDAAPVSNASQSVLGEQVVASSAPDVQARSRTQDMALEEGIEAQAPRSRKRKREEISTPTQGEASVKTEGRPKRIRRPLKWYEG